MSDGKTPMERFEDLGRKLFSKRKEDLKRVPEPEEDAEEIIEGGVRPTESEDDEYDHAARYEATDSSRSASCT